MESIRKTELEEKILALCERHLGTLGFRAVDVDCRVAGRSLVRIFIERIVIEPSGGEAGQAGTATLGDCTEASRAIGAAFDAEDLIPTGFDLEVSSPGLDRRLRLAPDFERAVGNEVKLKLSESIPGLGANVTGRLLAVEAGALRVDSQKKEWPIPLKQILRANMVWRAG